METWNKATPEQRQRAHLSTAIPLGPVVAPVRREHGDTEHPMTFVGGFAGVTQEQDGDGAVRPVIRWAVCDGE